LSPKNGAVLKKLLEFVLCIFHPIAVVLIWIHLVRRDDLRTGPKIAWAIFSIVPLVPFVYIFTGNDFL
jgi:hypothetical protein